MADINLPDSPFVDLKTGQVRPEWRLWLIKPSVQGVNTTTPLGATSGGTGLSASPNVGQLLVGNGLGAFSLITTLPGSAFPALTGDVSNSAGATITTLATVNATPGSFGSGTAVSTFTVNVKGLVTASGSTAITGAPGSFTAVGAFGCNTKAAQTAAASGAAVVTTAATNAAPFGYTTAAQADRIVTLLNTIQAALIANGILT